MTPPRPEFIGFLHVCPQCIRAEIINPFGPKHPTQAKLFEAIMAAPGCHSAQSLIDEIWPTGYQPKVEDIYAAIRKMKDALRPMGVEITSKRGWSGAGYTLVTK